MKDWLLSAAEEVKAMASSSAPENGRCIVCIAIIFCCLHHLIPRRVRMSDIPLDNMAQMLSMLALKPDLEKKSCVDYDIVKESCSGEEAKLAEALRTFCTHLLHEKDLRSPEWLFSVPLIHFLRGVSKPFERPVFVPEKIQWGDKTLGLGQIRGKTNDKEYGYVKL